MQRKILDMSRIWLSLLTVAATVAFLTVISGCAGSGSRVTMQRDRALDHTAPHYLPALGLQRAGMPLGPHGRRLHLLQSTHGPPEMVTTQAYEATRFPFVPAPSAHCL